MPKNSTSQSSGNNSQGQQGSQSGSKKMLYIIAIVAVVAVVLIVAYFLTSPSSSSPVFAQNRSANSTSIYMSTQQAQALVGSSLSSYNTTDMFNPNAPVNISEATASVPQLYGNVTSAWLTSASGSNATQNASIQYFAFQTANPSSISSLLASSVTSGMVTAPQVANSGASNGLTYSYDAYENSTGNFQFLSGWKNRNAVMLMAFSSNSFLINETVMVNTVANVTP